MTETNFNLLDNERHWNLLGHKVETEIRPIKKNPDGTNKVLQSIFCHSKEDFSAVCLRLNGQFNLYAGLQERTNKGTTSKDVKTIRLIFLGDVDAGLEHKNRASTPEEINQASAITSNISHFIEKKTDMRPSNIFSGNGFQLFSRIPDINITDENREKVQAQIRMFSEAIISKFSTKNVKIDNVSDFARVSRISGTLNLKGNKLATFVEYNPETNNKLREFILSLELPKVQRTLCSTGLLPQATNFNVSQMEEKCLFLKNNINRNDLSHLERVGIMFLYLKLGNIGERRLYEILSRQSNYNFPKTNKFIDGYKRKQNFLGVSCRKLIAWNVCHYSQCPCYDRAKNRIGAVI